MCVHKGISYTTQQMASYKSESKAAKSPCMAGCYPVNAQISMSPCKGKFSPYNISGHKMNGCVTTLAGLSSLPVQQGVTL